MLRFLRNKKSGTPPTAVKKTSLQLQSLLTRVKTSLQESFAHYKSLPTAPSSAMTVLAGLCLACGLAGMIGTAYALQEELWMALAIAAITAFAFGVSAHRKQTFILTAAVTIISLAAMYIVLSIGSRNASGMAWVMKDMLSYLAMDVREVYPEVLQGLSVFSGLACGFVGGLSAGRRHIWLGIPAAVFVIYGLWSLDLTVSTSFAALTAFSLILIQLAAYQFPYLKHPSPAALDRMLILTLPVAAVLVGICLWNAMITTHYYHSVGLERKIHYTQDMFSVYAKNTPPRTPFSLARTGSRLFVNRLGGPITPDPTTVLIHVESRHEMGLKGAVYNEYTGNNWKDTTASLRYALTSSNRDKQKEVFDLEILDEKLHVPYTFSEVKVMMPRAQNNSALFVPYRVDEFKVDGFMNLYPFFNDKGEVFSTRNIEKGISYTVSAKLPDFDGVSFRRIWQNQATKIENNPAKLEKIDALYTDLPDTVPESIYTLAQDLTRDQPNDLERALAIRQYLAENFKYTTDVAEPDPEEDFVAHFLSTGEGYCSYFASAMAVLARAADLPSRYVEGYNLDTKGQLTKNFYLSAAQSHAWAEVYVEGLGWVPMDPTTVEIYEQNSSGAQNHQSHGISTAPEEDYDAYEAYDDILSDMEDLNVMEPVTLWERYLILWIALMVLIPPMILIPILHPDARRYRKSRQSLWGSMRWEYEEMMRILSCLNLPRGDGETLKAYAERISQWVKVENPSIKETMEWISRFSYTAAKPSLSDLRRLEAAHRGLKKYARKVLGFMSYTRFVTLRLSYREPKKREAGKNQ